jgi:hypothetical protein
MNAAAKLGAYVGGLAVVFAGSVGAGQLIGPDRPAESTSQSQSSHQMDETEKTEKMDKQAEHGGHTETETGTGEVAELQVPGGLQIAQDGYQLVTANSTVRPGTRTDFRFTVTGSDGKPLTRFETAHEKKLHLIVVRRDLSGFQHVHPTMAANGEWSVPLTLTEPGAYRVFADFQPAGAKDGLTLGADVFVPGELRTVPRPTSQVSTVDGYSVRLDGELEPGKTSKLTLTVSKDGKPVSDLQPYLGAYGHLVALRDGDLAYLHVHPDGEPGDGKTKPGPGITFYAEVPSSGTYGLYLDFQHQGKVRTAEFTATAEAEEER